MTVHTTTVNCTNYIKYKYSIFHWQEFAWREGAAILASVLIIVLITAQREYKERHEQDQLNAFVMDKAAVIRDSNLQEVSVEQLVVGDVVQISSESTLPADGLLIQVSLIITILTDM